MIVSVSLRNVLAGRSAVRRQGGRQAGREKERHQQPNGIRPSARSESQAPEPHGKVGKIHETARLIVKELERLGITVDAPADKPRGDAGTRGLPPICSEAAGLGTRVQQPDAVHTGGLIVVVEMRYPFALHMGVVLVVNREKTL